MRGEKEGGGLFNVIFEDNTIGERSQRDTPQTCIALGYTIMIPREDEILGYLTKTIDCCYSVWRAITAE